MRIGLRSEVVLASLAAALEDDDDDVRTRAALAVGMLGGDASSLVTELIDALADRSAEVRAAAAVALGLVAPLEERAVAALVEALGDEDKGVRRAAGSTLTIDVSSLPSRAGDLLVGRPGEVAARPRRQVARVRRLQGDARLDSDITAR
jgi:HEAT repeat protein